MDPNELSALRCILTVNAREGIHFVRNGIKLVFEDRSAGKPAFVFVHGTSCNRSFFAPQAEHFARRHRVVSVDLRGHGESDKPPGPYPIAAYADDIAYIIEQVGLSKIVAVGHSMGGVIVLQLAAAHLDCVAAIVMVDPPLVFSPERRAVMEAMVAATEAGNDEPRSQWVKNMFLPTSDRRLMEEVVAVMLSAPPQVAASAVRGVLEFDSPAAAALCTVPALHLAASPPRMPPASSDPRPFPVLDPASVEPRRGAAYPEHLRGPFAAREKRALGHHLVNRGKSDVVYLEVGDRRPGDDVAYPDDDLAALWRDGRRVYVHTDGRPY